MTSEGKNIAKNSVNLITPVCQTISVVISPNGEKAPPAFAATTILTQAIVINFLLSLPIDITTVLITRAVVKLSATADRKNAIIPVSQKVAR